MAKTQSDFINHFVKTLESWNELSERNHGQTYSDNVVSVIKDIFAGVTPSKEALNTAVNECLDIMAFKDSVKTARKIAALERKIETLKSTV